MPFSEPLSVWVNRFLMPLDDPSSRLFHLNLILALALVVSWIIFAHGPRQVVPLLQKWIFRKKYWWNRSTRFDYKIYFINSILKVLLFVPFLDFTFSVASYTSRGLIRLNDGFAGLQPTTFSLLLMTVGTFVWDDFLRFGQHYLMHKVPFLWRLHSMHHSARILTPITLYRNHPVESAIATMRNSLSLGVATGVFVFLFESQFSLVTLFGVNAFGFMFNFLGANLRHSHIPIGFGRSTEQVFISPLQHQIHHSLATAHRDKNFGVSLAIWDRLFGTLVYSKGVGLLRFGLK